MPQNTSKKKEKQLSTDTPTDRSLLIVLSLAGLANLLLLLLLPVVWLVLTGLCLVFVILLIRKAYWSKEPKTGSKD